MKRNKKTKKKKDLLIYVDVNVAPGKLFYQFIKH